MRENEMLGLCVVDCIGCIYWTDVLHKGSDVLLTRNIIQETLAGGRRKYKDGWQICIAYIHASPTHPSVQKGIRRVKSGWVEWGRAA